MLWAEIVREVTRREVVVAKAALDEGASRLEKTAVDIGLGMRRLVKPTPNRHQDEGAEINGVANSRGNCELNARALFGHLYGKSFGTLMCTRRSRGCSGRRD